MQEHAEPAREPSRAARWALVVDLADLGRGDGALAGGKGANLGELIHAGIRVPAGFVVTTRAYDRFVEANGLGHLGRADGDQLRAAFRAAPIPPEIQQAVWAAYERLGRGPVAVRSSATAEDLADAAAAGQQETFLNVIGEEALLDAIRHCWASLWSDRAILYRSRVGLDLPPKLAVVVQRLVAAEHAGVLFTANPVTGARDEVVIDASAGLGEAVVAGLVTPEHAVLRRRPWGWRVAEHQGGRAEVAVRPRPGGGTAAVAEAAAEDLPRRVLRRLARLGRRIERHFGRPQDVEWAWADGRLLVLQARPITALPAPPPSSVQRKAAAFVAEFLPERPYPLELTTWVATMYGFVRQSLGWLGVGARPLEELFEQDDGVVVRYAGALPFRPGPRMLLAPLRLLALARGHDPAGWAADPLLAEAVERARALEERDPGTLSWEELLGAVREALAIPGLVWELRVRYVLPTLPAVAGLVALLVLLGRADRVAPLLFTGIASRTLDVNRALEALAAGIRAEPWLAEAFARHRSEELAQVLEAHEAGRAFLAELRRFLAEYGHREGGGTLQVFRPTWRERPEVVLGLLQAMVRAPATSLPPPRWEEARLEVLAHPMLGFRPLRALFLALLERARRFQRFREDTRFYLLLPLPALRRTLLELGRRLVAVGALETPAQVFHLELDDLRGLAGAWPPGAEAVDRLRDRVRRRRARRAALERTPLVDPRLLDPGPPRGDVLLRGVPGSPGVAEGVVRVVRDAGAFDRLRPGEILVVPFTNPAWTPLFARAAAVVADSGGVVSHAAIVAREYGIPAVMATGDGTRRLRDGQRVRVDGTTGRVLDAAPIGH